MKLQPDKSEVQTINAHDRVSVTVNGERIEHSVILGSRGERMAWECQKYDDLKEAHFDRLAELAPELIIFGSGHRIRFPKSAWLAQLMQRRIGVETMDTAAACRTYNILAAEGRHVIAALIIETSD